MTELIPRSVLFGNPIRTSPQISPDGTLLAYLAPVDGVLNIWVRDVDAANDRPVTADIGRGIQLFRWSADGSKIFYIQDIDGDENYHLYTVGLDGGAARDLTPFPDVRARIVSHVKRHPNRMLIALNRDNPQIHDVYELDLTTGELDLVSKNPGNELHWLTDSDLKLRVALTANGAGGFDLLHRFTEEEPWKLLLDWGVEDCRSSGPVSFSEDGTSLLLFDSRGANAARLVRLDLATGALTTLAADPAYDVMDVLLHPETYEVQLVGIMRDRMEWQVCDPSLADDLAAISALHHGDFSVINSDDSDSVWIIRFIADDAPVTFYMYDRRTQRGVVLFDARPELRAYDLATMKPVCYRARDGLTVHGYITFPAGAEHARLPMVLKVHGGPWVRDAWGFESEAQWLANRGYICLQVNYRGSTGYGKDFLNAGDKEWGGRMHDDLVDAVRWAVECGYADPDRIAIYGGSYGGYAALVGATFTPDLFRCAVDIVGPSNLITFIETIPEYWKPNIELFHRRVGNPQTEAEFLIARSPLSRVDAITIPLLIAQGANDPRVKQSESEQIVEAMRAKGIPHEYMLFEDEGHGFARPENRMIFYAKAERFLAEHLGGRFEEG